MIFCSAIVSAKCPYFFIDFALTQTSQNFENDDFTANFEIKNVSKTQISSFTVVFSVCTEDSVNPFDGDNTVIVKIEEPVEAEESFCFSINLKNYLDTDNIEDELHIENLFLRTVSFSDGTKWKDYFGSYAVSQDF